MIGGEEAFGFALVERGHDLCIGPGVAGVKRRPSFLQPLSVQPRQHPATDGPGWAIVSGEWLQRGAGGVRTSGVRTNMIARVRSCG
jgi:hypothetical protein